MAKKKAQKADVKQVQAFVTKDEWNLLCSKLDEFQEIVQNNSMVYGERITNLEQNISGLTKHKYVFWFESEIDDVKKTEIGNEMKKLGIDVCIISGVKMPGLFTL
jgi:hypothetical protein